MPATTVNVAAHTGYFQDPYPVHFAAGSAVQYFSGTTKALMSCAYPLTGQCFALMPLTIQLSGDLAQQISDAGSSFTNFQNLDIYQTADGGWHMALAVGVNSPSHPFHWTVILHASPQNMPAAGGVPTAWIADQVLVGAFGSPVAGNYDPKYIENDGQLYLIYVRRVPNSDPARNVIVAQAMTSPTQIATSNPTVLLAPDDANGGFASELFDTVVDEAGFKVVEVANIAKVGGKFAMVYSVGKYNEANYKAGIAWSDTFLPANGATYRKVLQTDTQGVWGQAGRQEVRYLLQSQVAAWPNYTADQVVGPGVPSLIQGPQGAWFLFFAGFDPGDRPQDPDYPAGEYLGSSRRPYFVGVKVAVPTGASVASASDADLATWLQPATR